MTDRRRANRTRTIIGVVAALCCLATAVLVPATPSAAATIDGSYDGIGPIGPDSTLDVTIAGRGSVPASGVGSVALNVTATNATAVSYLTIFPKGSTRPNASNLNVGPGQITPNMVIVPLGTNGQISIYNAAGTVNVIVDVLGYFPTGTSYTGLNPARFADTRPGKSTIDNISAGVGPVGADSTLDVAIAGRGAVPANGVGSVALNVTATNGTAVSYLTVFPTGSDRPNASNLNVRPAQTRPNMVIVPLGAGGTISIYNAAGTVNVIVDVLGYFPSGASYTGLNPARFLDTRPGQTTVDGQAAGGGPVGADSTLNLTIAGRDLVPVSGVGSVALNVTPTGPTAVSFLTVFPTGSPRPNASNLNLSPGQVTPNMVIVPLGTNGQISIYNAFGSVNVIVDVLGYFPSGGSYTGLNPSRFVDTRTPPPAAPAAIGSIRNLLVATPLGQQMSGLDRIAVWVCDVPANTTSPDYKYDVAQPLVVNPQAVADWATVNVAPYYAKTSYGRYRVQFTPLGRIQLSATEGTSDCLDKAMALTPAPYTNVFATDTSTRGDGFGSPGYVWSNESLNYFNFTKPPSQTSRGFWVGGGSIVENPAPNIVVHEIGHTVKWPHSNSGLMEYDNPVDVMSGFPLANWCRRDLGGGGYVSWPCIPQNTLAFNRYAAGWIDEQQVRLQTSGSNSYTLDAPGGSGIQMIAAPDATNALVMLTLEARPRSGNDASFTVEGVAAHIIDQRVGACYAYFAGSRCMGTQRVQRQAITSSDGYNHVLQVGTTTVIRGVTITVTAKSGNGFTVTVSGAFSAAPVGQAAQAQSVDDTVVIVSPDVVRPVLS